MAKRLSHIFTTLLFIACVEKPSPYLGQPLPSTQPALFATDIVNTDAIELNGVFNPSMTEFFFTRIVDGKFIIHHIELIDGIWGEPQPIYMYPDKSVESIAVDMTITQDGKKMYFLGRYQQDTSINASLDIYVSEKKEGKWQHANLVPAPVSTPDYNELYPIVVADGSLYFISNRPGSLSPMDVYRAQYLGEGKFDTPENLGNIINGGKGSGDTFVAPDESYLIYSTTRQEGPKGLHISFKKDNEWQTPINLGATVNKMQVTNFCPYMTPDNKYFLFSRRYSDPVDSGWEGVKKGEMLWMDASVIFDLNE